MKEGAHHEVEGLTDRVFAVQEREGKERERQILRSLIKESGKREGERDHHKRLHARLSLSLSLTLHAKRQQGHRPLFSAAVGRLGY